MVTVFDSLFSTHGRFIPCGSTRVVLALSRANECADKRSLKRWAAIRSKDGRRRTEDIIAITALVYDVDDLPVSLAALAEALQDVHAFIVSTWSATEAAPRWRVVIFIDREITLEEFPRVWRAGAELFEHVLPPSTSAKDASHIWAVSARQPGGCFAFQETTGAELCVADALVRFPKPEPIEAPVVEIKSPSAYARAALSSAAATIATSGGGVRNATMNREAFGVARFIASGEITEEEFTRTMLAAAASARIPVSEANATLRSCLRGRRTA